MNKMKFWKNILIILYLTKNMQNSIILHLLINNKENKRYKIVKHNLYLYTQNNFPDQLCTDRERGEQTVQRGIERQNTSRYLIDTALYIYIFGEITLCHTYSILHNFSQIDSILNINALFDRLDHHKSQTEVKISQLKLSTTKAVHFNKQPFFPIFSKNPTVTFQKISVEIFKIGKSRSVYS